MSDVKWIKITTDIFDDEKIILIERLPSADSVITIWFKLLVLAGKQNNNGVFLMNDKIAYTDEMLATIFRRDLSTVRFALKTFEEFDMIDIVDDVITIPNWNKHQTLDSYERKKERDRIYQAKRREKQRLIAKNSSDNRLTHDDSSPEKSSDVVVSDIDIEIDIDKDNIIVSKDTICQTDVRHIVQKWNELQTVGIKPVIRFVKSSKRYKNLVARIREYGTEKILIAIDKIKESNYLQGKNKHGWAITFDWFVLPSNFPKVLEGNYDNRKEKINDEQSNRTTTYDDRIIPGATYNITTENEDLFGDLSDM